MKRYLVIVMLLTMFVTVPSVPVSTTIKSVYDTLTQTKPRLKTKLTSFGRVSFFLPLMLARGVKSNVLLLVTDGKLKANQ